MGISRHAGHFVQVFKPLGPNIDYRPKPLNRKASFQHPNYVTVEGRTTTRTVTSYPIHFADGWFQLSRELPRNRAIKFARAYKKAGFSSRVIFRGNDGKMKITDEFLLK